ncbi:hypothetical protein ACIBSR_34205 [Streptomyces sp. NPDC049936]|uniref:hypothetical protein n=1 Tax=Streptomyces sp. NPDC049936 TaxID=3365599 RepID=UPI0037AD2DD6
MSVHRRGRDEILGMAYSDHDLVVFLARRLRSRLQRRLRRLTDWAPGRPESEHATPPR